MPELKGMVEQVGFKPVTTKFGSKNTYSLKIGGQWVSCGFKDPKVAVGDEVSCVAEDSAYGLQTKGISVLARGKVSPFASKPVAMAPSASNSYSKVFPIPLLHGDRSIIRQNSLARATDLYIAARAASKTTYELDHEDWDFIIHIARQFEAYSAGDLDMQEAKNEMETATNSHIIKE